jgi:hypothetical protein
MPQSKTDAELVRLAAERVMGWTQKVFCDYCDHCEGHGGMPVGWNPLTSDADCWMMVDKLTAEWCFMLDWQQPEWSCEFHRCGLDDGDRTMSDIHIATERDRRRCILLACLRAVGVDV